LQRKEKVRREFPIWRLTVIVPLSRGNRGNLKKHFEVENGDRLFNHTRLARNLLAYEWGYLPLHNFDNSSLCVAIKNTTTSTRSSEKVQQQE
jgi:hypothetical protein